MQYDALTYDFSVLRRKLFDHASSLWEGDNVTLKANLIDLTRNWSQIATTDPCPISFSEDEISECLRLKTAQVEADEQLQACRDAVGIGPEGWVPLEQYGEKKQRADKLKAYALEAAESEKERQELCQHWIFDDFDEDEYS